MRSFRCPRSRWHRATSGHFASYLEVASLLVPDGEPNAPPVPAKPIGRVLLPASIPASSAYRIREEEVPREGTRVSRVPRWARSSDGSTHLWIARRRSAGAGEGWSGLRFDLALAATPVDEP